MAEKPVSFTPWSVQSILAGEKTETSRPMKPQPGSDVIDLIRHGEEWLEVRANPGGVSTWGDVRHKPKYVVDDILWIREPWRTTALQDNVAPRNLHEISTIWYEAGGQLNSLPRLQREPGRLRPGMVLPKRFARPERLRVLSISVKRVQELSPAEIHRDGIKWGTDISVRMEWARKWSEIYGRKSWEANPWVWRYTFALTEQLPLSVGVDGGRK